MIRDLRLLFLAAAVALTAACKMDPEAAEPAGPDAVTVSAGQNVQFVPIVSTNGFAPKSVVWSVDDDAAADGVTITQQGVFTIPAEATVTEITVTATSVYTPTVSDTATITIA